MKLQRVVTNWHQYRKAIALLTGATVIGASIATVQKISSFAKWVRVGSAFNAGVVTALNGADERAIVNFTRALTIEPDFLPAYEQRGTAHLAIENYESAIADLLRAAPTSKEKDQISLALGDAYFVLGDTTNALTHYSAALVASPDLAEAHVGEGNVYYQQQDYWKAFEKFEKALEIDTELLNARWGKAIVQAQMANSDESKESLSTVISDVGDPLTQSLQPDNDTIYLTLGEIAYGKGNYQRGHELITKAIELNDKNPLAYLLQGIAHTEEKEHQAALEAYAKASRLLTVKQFGIGVFLSRDAATKAVKIESIAKDAKNALQELAQAPQKGDLVLAIDEQPVVDITMPEFKDQLKGEKNSTVQLKLYREDEGDLTIEIPRQYDSTQPFLAVLFTGRAYTYRELGEGEQAIANCEQFKATKVEDAYAYSVCGEVHQLFGEKETAIQYFQDALELYTAQENEVGIKEIEKALSEIEIEPK